MCTGPGQVKLKTIKLVFTLTLLISLRSKMLVNSGAQSGAEFLLIDCCFSELNL